MASKRRRSEVDQKPQKPATSPEARENELVSLAHDLAEQQIRDGNASSQVITHFLKLGSSREKLEQLRLEHENELTRVKIENAESAKKVEDLYEAAIAAMRSYSGLSPREEDTREEEIGEQ